MAKRPSTPTASDDGAATTRAATAPAEGGSRATGEPPKLTPTAALARHLEWLEYALGAARAEEAARSDRVEKATKKNREKRSSRLAEVRAEVDELTALLAGIRDLQAKARGSRARKPANPRTRVAPAKGSTTRRRSNATAAPGS